MYSFTSSTVKACGLISLLRIGAPSKLNFSMYLIFGA
ncbi:unnamed protein product, partial [marine sediment metagenome]